MADIYTHLRELGVAFSFFNERDIKDITPAYFLTICKEKINMQTQINISMIANNNEYFNEKEFDILKNAVKLGNAIKSKRAGSFLPIKEPCDSG